MHSMVHFITIEKGTHLFSSIFKLSWKMYQSYFTFWLLFFLFYFFLFIRNKIYVKTSLGVVWWGYKFYLKCNRVWRPSLKCIKQTLVRVTPSSTLVTFCARKKQELVRFYIFIMLKDRVKNVRKVRERWKKKGKIRRRILLALPAT